MIHLVDLPQHKVTIHPLKLSDAGQTSAVSLTVLSQQCSSVGDGLQRQPDIGAVGPEHQQRLQDGQQLEGHWGAAHLHEPEVK